MTKSYGICMTDCEVTDEVGKATKLLISSLVQIVFTNDEKGTYAIKLLKDDGTPNIDNKTITIYHCQKENICIIKCQLLKFLTISDDWGRLDILRFKNKILNLKEGSKGKLQVLYNNSTYFINFEVKQIGPVLHSHGHYVVLVFPEFDRVRHLNLWHALFNTLAESRNEKFEYLIVRVEHLFSEIELSDPPQQSIYLNSSEQIKDFGLRNTQNASNIITDAPKYDSNNNPHDHMDVDNNSFGGNKSISSVHQNYDKHRNSSFVNDSDVEKCRTMKMCMICDNLENLFTFSCNHPFCYRCIMKRLDFIKIDSNIKCPSCYLDLQVPDIELFSQFLDLNLMEEDQFKNKHVFHDQSLQKTTPHDNEILKGSNSEYLGQKVKKCLFCQQLENLFTFPCADVFCYKCILKSLDPKHNSFTICPKCGVILRNHHELELLNKFVNYNISTEETSSKTKDKQTSKNVLPITNNKNWWQFNNDKKNGSTEKEKNKSGGNKIENRFCKSCRKQNNNSAISCVSCHRPLAC